MERLENFQVQIGILILAEIAAVVMLQFSGITLNVYLIWLMLVINVLMII